MHSPLAHRRRFPAVALAVALAVFALPAAAGADTYCVNKDSCPGGQPKPDIASALLAAKDHAGPDRVEIGPKDTPYNLGTLSYQEPAGNPVTIVGAGTSGTALTYAAPYTVLSLGNGSSVRALRIELASGGGKGLQLDGASAQDIVVHGAGDQTGAIGIGTSGDAQISESTVAMSGGTGVQPSSAGGVTTVTDSKVRAASAIIAVYAEAKVTRSRLTGGARGAAVFYEGAKLELADTLVRTAGAGATGLESAEGGILAATNVTVAGTGASAGTGTGAWVHTSDDSGVLQLRNSIVDGYLQSLHCTAVGADATSTLLVGSSSYDAATASTSQFGGCEALLLANNLDEDPQFVNPDPSNPLVTPSFRLSWSSPLIDAGESVNVTQDLDGNARSVNGDGKGDVRVDLGAYEYQRRAPTAVLTGPDSATAGTPVELDAGGSSDPDGGDTLAYSWSFGDGQSATGRKVSHAFGAAGTREVTLTVTDPTGLADEATKTIAVTGGDAGAGPSGGGDAGAGPEGGTARGAAPRATSAPPRATSAPPQTPLRRCSRTSP